MTRAHPAGDPLDLVEEAVAVAVELTEVADHLIGHFVDHARGRGLSWTQIGTRLGVSKQAARKRFAVLAQDNARRYDNHYIGTEHILLGVCQERSGLGVRVIASAGVSVAVVKRAVIARMRGAERGGSGAHSVCRQREEGAGADAAGRVAARARACGHEHQPGETTCGPE